MSDISYWPFDVLPPEKQTEFHRQVVEFLDRALREGYEPYVFGGSSYGAKASCGRKGEIIHRGANRYWELVLVLEHQREIALHVDGFSHSAEALLQWLRGQPIVVIVSRLEDFIVSRPGVHGWGKDTAKRGT